VIKIMFNFLENTTVDDILGLDGYSCATSDFFPILEATKFIIRIIQIAVPFGLIIWGSLDWFKALIAHDEKEMRMKRKPFLARVIAAMIVLVLPWIMTLISKVVAGESNTADFWTCYHEAKPRIDFTKLQIETGGGEGIIGGFKDSDSGTTTNGVHVTCPGLGYGCSGRTTDDYGAECKATSTGCDYK
jgi:hypothetical protein